MVDKSEDIKKISEQFLDLWQRQLTATMKNPETVGSMIQMMHNMQQNMGKIYGFSKAAAANSGVSESRDDELLQLDRRLRACEERLDKLESGAKGKGRPARKTNK